MYIVRQIGAGRKQAFGLAKTDEAGRKMISKTLSGRPAIRRGNSYRYPQLTLPLTAGLEQNRFSERLIRPPQDGEVILYGQRPTL
jgi:hypothetical protein